MRAFVNPRLAPSVGGQPIAKVEQWRAFEAQNGEWHLLVLNQGVLRISSAIASIDGSSATLSTQSGRRYQLLGSPEVRRPQRLLMAEFAQQSGIADADDVSEELWKMCVH